MPKIYKFQGKVRGHNKMVQGDLIHDPAGDMIQYIEDGQAVKVEVIPETVGQFTGFRDSKRTDEYPEGQEIYEGDKITSPSVCGQISGVVRFGVYEAIHYGFYIDWDDKSIGMRQDFKFWVPKLTVIGENNNVDQA